MITFRLSRTFLEARDGRGFYKSHHHFGKRKSKSSGELACVEHFSGTLLSPCWWCFLSLIVLLLALSGLKCRSVLLANLSSAGRFLNSSLNDTLFGGVCKCISLYELSWILGTPRESANSRRLNTVVTLTLSARACTQMWNNFGEKKNQARGRKPKVCMLTANSWSEFFFLFVKKTLLVKKQKKFIRTSEVFRLWNRVCSTN